MNSQIQRIHLIINPVAGRGRAGAAAETIRRSFQTAGFRTPSSFSSPDQNHDSIKAIRSEVDAIVAVGGDGTANAVMQGILEGGVDRSCSELPALGIIPFGTGNATVSAFGIPRRLHDSFRAIMAGKARCIDVGVVVREDGRQEFFMLWLGAGLDAEVMHHISETRSGRLGVFGLLKRVPTAIVSSLRYPFHEIEVEIDDRAAFHATTVMIANVGHTGLMGNVAPKADASDGLLDVVSTSHVSPADWLHLVFSALQHRLDECEGVSLHQATRVKLKTRGHVPVHIDGDAAGKLPVEVTVKPHAIRLIVP